MHVHVGENSSIHKEKADHLRICSNLLKITRRFKNNILLTNFFFFFLFIAWWIFFFLTLNSSATWHGSNSVNFWPISTFFRFFEIPESFWKKWQNSFFCHYHILALLIITQPLIQSLIPKKSVPKNYFKIITKSKYSYLTVLWKNSNVMGLKVDFTAKMSKKVHFFL